MSGFDLDVFKNAAIQGAMEDHFTPPPADVYGARIVDFNVTQSPGKKDATKTYTFLKIVWGLEDPTGKVKEATGQDEARAGQDIGLDLTPDGKLAIGKGKNIGLGALRTALGQNAEGKPWAPSMLVNAKAKVKVELEKFTRRDGGDGQKAIVTSVTSYNSPASGAGAARPSAMPSRPAAR
jgi:hypothetical protein